MYVEPILAVISFNVNFFIFLDAISTNDSHVLKSFINIVCCAKVSLCLYIQECSIRYDALMFQCVCGYSYNRVFTDFYVTHHEVTFFIPSV